MGVRTGHACTRPGGGRSPTDAGAFTLIELLAVIAILLVLASLLIPVLGEVVERARRLICVNNTRNLQVGYNMSVSDNDGSLPNGCTGGPDAWSSGGDFKIGRIWPYVNEEKTYSCPAFPQPDNGMKRHYSITWFISCEARSWGPCPYEAKTLSSIKNPGKTFVFVEEYDRRQVGRGIRPGPQNGYWGVIPNGRWGDCPPIWHDWGANFSFMDGHAEYRKWEGPKMRRLISTHGRSPPTPGRATRWTPWTSYGCSTA
jgi:prepilin-type N-terminal cleavage/methylation domain-containing protein/prepilin-type processing-associated H-X9-DG protein